MNWYKAWQILTGSCGFKVDEVMSGTHKFVTNFDNIYGVQLAGGPMEFCVTWGPRRIGEFMRQLLTGKPAVSELSGAVDIAGLCNGLAIKGTLELRYFVDATLRYEFEFNVDGRDYRFIGVKRNLRPWNLLKTHTTCYGMLLDVTGDEAGMTNLLVSESVTRFRLYTIPASLRSFRFT